MAVKVALPAAVAVTSPEALMLMLALPPVFAQVTAGKVTLGGSVVAESWVKRV